jgi:hypothetical protein
LWRNRTCDCFAAAIEELTDSMKMFRWGLEDGRPEPGTVGTPPEWFYKGNGTMLRAHRKPLDIPSYGEDGGEEAEVAGVNGCGSIYQLASTATAAGTKLSHSARQRATGDILDYILVYGGRSEWCLLPPIDHPDDPGRFLISGTGLTHLGCASNR